MILQTLNERFRHVFRLEVSVQWSLPFKLIRQTGIIRIKVITIAWSIAIWILSIITLFVALRLCCVVDSVRLVQMDSTMWDPIMREMHSNS